MLLKLLTPHLVFHSCSTRASRACRPPCAGVCRQLEHRPCAQLTYTDPKWPHAFTSRVLCSLCPQAPPRPRRAPRYRDDNRIGRKNMLFETYRLVYTSSQSSSNHVSSVVRSSMPPRPVVSTSRISSLQSATGECLQDLPCTQSPPRFLVDISTRVVSISVCKRLATSTPSLRCVCAG
jgi:hypothetical protein